MTNNIHYIQGELSDNEFKTLIVKMVKIINNIVCYVSSKTPEQLYLLYAHVFPNMQNILFEQNLMNNYTKIVLNKVVVCIIKKKMYKYFNLNKKTYLYIQTKSKTVNKKLEKILYTDDTFLKSITQIKESSIEFVEYVNKLSNAAYSDEGLKIFANILTDILITILESMNAFVNKNSYVNINVLFNTTNLVLTVDQNELKTICDVSKTYKDCILNIEKKIEKNSTWSTQSIHANKNDKLCELGNNLYIKAYTQQLILKLHDF